KCDALLCLFRQSVEWLRRLYQWMQMPMDLSLMSDPLIRRSRSSYAMQAEIISLDIRFIPMEHTHSLVPKSPQLWLRPRAFCGVTNMASKSGIHIGRYRWRPCY